MLPGDAEAANSLSTRKGGEVRASPSSSQMFSLRLWNGTTRKVGPGAFFRPKKTGRRSCAPLDSLATGAILSPIRSDGNDAAHGGTVDSALLLQSNLEQLCRAVESLSNVTDAIAASD